MAQPQWSKIFTRQVRVSPAMSRSLVALLTAKNASFAYIDGTLYLSDTATAIYLDATRKVQ